MGLHVELEVLGELAVPAELDDGEMPVELLPGPPSPINFLGGGDGGGAQ